MTDTTNTTAASVAANNCTILPDGSAFAVASFPLPKDHWLYAPREYDVDAEHPKELPSPILTHALRAEVVSAIRYAIRGATMCGKETDFDPDALVQNAVYALCGPYRSVALAAPAQAVPASVIMASVMRDDGGEHPAFCLMVAYRAEKDAMAALAMLTDEPAQAAAPDMTDAYAGAREDLSIWKKRALEAEALNRKFAASVNSPSFMGEPAALAQAGEYPPLVCDYCGALTPDPWHSSGMLHGKMSKHIHSCDACAAQGAAQAAPVGMEPTARIRYERNTPGRENEMPRVVSCNRMADGVYEVFTASQVQAMLTAAPRNATLYDPDEVAFPIQRSADGADVLPPELASTARPASIAAVEVAAPIAARLRLEGTQ